MITPPAVQEFLRVSLGMADDAVGKSVMSRAVSQAMRREGQSDPDAYETLFTKSAEVRQRFVDAVVVGETWFFRDRGPFAYLAKQVVGLRQKRAGEALAILSAPCSTGEEPYSVAMTLLAAGLPASAFRIDAVDVSLDALDKARRAEYGNASFRGHIGQEVAPYFETSDAGRRVTRQVVRQVAFLHDNLVATSALIGRGPYAVIFCRNLLIYLTPPARQKVFEKLDRLLLPGGILFAGHTETVFWHQQGYIPVQSERAFALTKPEGEGLAPKAKPLTAMKVPAVSKEEVGPAPSPAPKTSGTVPDRIAPPSSADPPSIHEKLQEARRLADKGDMDGALLLCQAFGRAFGPSAEMYGLLGVIRMATKDFPGAEDCFLKALYLDPGHYESLVHISLLCEQKGDAHRAALYRKRAERLAAEKGKNNKTSETVSGAKENRVKHHG